MKILDCTLRDGGYYNSWDFDPLVVKAYLQAMADAKIDYVELGLRNFPKSGFLGAFAYTTESMINKLHLPDGPTYGVMVDAKTILTSEMSVASAVDMLFVDSSESKIDLVRVAAHFDEVEDSGAIVKALKKKGYIVGFNLMQAGGKPSEIISSKAHIAESWEVLDCLYFADSLGNMDASEVQRIYEALRSKWAGKIGIHTHNNMTKGLDNSLKALELGVEWIDSTVTGMGRGAGNTQTETLLAVLGKEATQYKCEPIYDLVIRHFESMQAEYGWGSNLLYFLGAQNNIHPTYIQNLLSNTHYGTDEIIGAISYLSELEGTTSYNGSVLSSALNFTNKDAGISGSRDLQSIFSGREVLVLTNGPSTEKYIDAVELYVELIKPIVISVNIVSAINQDLIDYYIISHNSKVLSDLQKYKELLKPIILPKHRFNSSELSELAGLSLLDFGLDVCEDTFCVKDEYVTVPHDNTVGYLLGAIISGGGELIRAVGFDGYDRFDMRQQEMIRLLSLYERSHGAVPIEALTPTSYPIRQGSIHAINRKV